MSKTIKIKLPNGKDYEITGSAQSMLHIYCTMKQGREIEGGHVDKFTPQFWKANKGIISGYAGTVVFDPEKDMPKETKKQPAKAETKPQEKDGKDNA